MYEVVGRHTDEVFALRNPKALVNRLYASFISLGVGNDLDLGMR